MNGCGARWVESEVVMWQGLRSCRQFHCRVVSCNAVELPVLPSGISKTRRLSLSATSLSPTSLIADGSEPTERAAGPFRTSDGRELRECHSVKSVSVSNRESTSVLIASEVVHVAWLLRKQLGCLVRFSATSMTTVTAELLVVY